ncbi:MAG: hypothetical protein A3F13_01825 [Gammaproteobacteria bacterium RIFCSPHIGHO2_12_FULL_40_19]|nr:MAG: hypothetical protein A3F13_01825 [Gammaproteobacteria bacterium RIFCSPHIGHO2_12_FULL_40_19]
MGNGPTIVRKDYFYDMPIDLFCVMHATTREIIEANLSFEYLLGWKPEEIVGNTLEAFISTETDKENLEKAFSKVKLGIHSLFFETEFRTKNNLKRHIDWKCYIDIENQHIYAIGRDITAHKESEKVLSEQTHIDHVTGVADRQTFLTLLQNELSGAVRYHYPTSVIMIDIDHFKNYNEQYGMQKGDECLRKVATALKTCLRRKTDFLARFENDEFAVLLTHNNLEKAIKSAEYLRASLEKLTTPERATESHHPITISLGVAALSETAEKEIASETMLSAVRRALRESQQRGGNQVNYAEDFHR